MEYGHFTEHGSAYEITTPLTPSAWTNCLFNDSYYLEPDQTLQGESSWVRDDNRSPCLRAYRYFYLVDDETNEVWNPNYLPLATMPEEYVCTHGIAYTQLRSLHHGVQTEIRVMVPPSGMRELWNVTLKNKSDAPRQLSFYVAFGFYDHGVMGGECTCDAESGVIIKYAFPYHVFYEEKEQAEQNMACAYLLSDEKPAGREMSRRRFFGAQPDCCVPEAVRRGGMSGEKAEAEEFCGALVFRVPLAPGESRSISLEAGAVRTREDALARKRCADHVSFEEEFRRTRAYWEEQFADFRIETPDANLNAFGNYWLKKQVTLLTRQNRGSSYCPVCNQLQDAMGYAMIQPRRAGDYLLRVLQLQKKDGSIQQWHDTTGAPPRGLGLLHHTDGPVWLVICAEVWLRQYGDRGQLCRQVPWQDGGEGTVLEHMTAAVRYLLEQVGEHGLCLMGDGDWNDPINGVGRAGRGESVWLSMALIFAIQQLAPDITDPACRDAFREAAEHMKDAVNAAAWCGRWYAAAIHDDGGIVGGEEERLFLNTQSWAILSGVADQNRQAILRETMKQLQTPFGPLILSPPFTEWDARWGRISVKQAGTTENGSVYCHASMFLAYAQALAGDGNGLYKTLRETLPTNEDNPPEKNTQVPIYLANYYFGLRDSANFGRSSCHYGTGTAAWMLMLLIEEIAGVKAEMDGIRLAPCLPDAWDGLRCQRRYRDAAYRIAIRRGETRGILVDGVPYQGKILPYEAGKVYNIEMTV